VPLAGLGRQLDDCIVSFGSAEEGERMMERTHKGRWRDVLRIQVPAGTREVCVQIAQENNKWRALCTEQAANTLTNESNIVETRKLDLFGTEVPVPTSPHRLPPVRALHKTC